MAAQGSNFIGIITVLLGFALIVALCRWAFTSNGVKQIRHRPDYGLLVPVARAGTRAAAEAMRVELARHGIRGTVAPAGRGFDAQGRPWPADSHVVLVFPLDEVRAAELTAPLPR